jgi:hypothetical protein
MYDSTTGVITINQAGRYVFNWWVATGCSLSNEAVFGLSSPAGDPVIGNSPQKAGQVSGFAVFDVDAPPAGVSLVYRGRPAICHSGTVPVKAALMVTGQARNMLKNLVDGNNKGAIRGIYTLDNYTMGEMSTALGLETKATGLLSHAEGYGNIASGICSHVEGNLSEASNHSCHAEGVGTLASGGSAHAEGSMTQALGFESHAEGYGSVASGNYAHAGGLFTDTNGHEGAHIMGRFGNADAGYSWFLANGISAENRGLAAKILSDGNAYAAAWNTDGADYAEMFETTDSRSIEPGYFVTFDAGEKVRTVTESDSYILGVSSVASGIMGNAGALHWKNKYLTDEWGRIRYHETETAEIRDKSGEIRIPAHTEVQPMPNPEWNPEREYIPRAQRPEWVCVALLGRLPVRDDGTCTPGGYCSPNAHGIATTAESGYRVLKRIGAAQVQIMLK